MTDQSTRIGSTTGRKAPSGFEPLLDASHQSHTHSIRTALTALCAGVFLALASSAGASPQARETLIVRIDPGEFVTRTTSHAFEADATIYAAVTVDGRDLAFGTSGRVVDFAGRGVIVRLVAARRDGPMRVRMASVRSRPVRVVVELRW